MTDWNEKLNLAASELESAREKRDDLIKETEAAIIRYQVEIETLFTELDVEKLLNDMNKVLFSGSGSLQVTKSWEDSSSADTEESEEDDEEVQDTDFISCVLEWEENGERELAVDVGRDESGLYIEVNGHEISMDEETLQAAVLYAVKEELDFV
ncbi:MAG: hypothetical protein FI721_06785 [SAR202 cluster bacterium]|jgi:hypothetical protein|nr:hypothetical protein [SAR202 cluster bacterium]MQG36435.1 hypothetical protein [SAR202 cluster bacterium]MQG52585.1 hypothetical protein [SAR202 cluster bacterium]MQG61037.1 hypothetical protein [SAR202 cluster bacterium]MQG86362.1 hypothetical protein [SAR202 cluster bacterium]|tara:strand:+ start:2660 stop:3121 length:462 start_codon:yes stop_codon:yes gene_type:complete